MRHISYQKSHIVYGFPVKNCTKRHLNEFKTLLTNIIHKESFFGIEKICQAKYNVMERKFKEGDSHFCFLLRKRKRDHEKQSRSYQSGRKARGPPRVRRIGHQITPRMGLKVRGKKKIILACASTLPQQTDTANARSSFTTGSSADSSSNFRKEKSLNLSLIKSRIETS